MVVMLPARLYAGVIQLGPVVSATSVISLTALDVRVCSRSHEESPSSSSLKADQLPVESDHDNRGSSGHDD
jgi:hypothetical protein